MADAPNPPAARFHDPVAHSHAQVGFLLGAVAGVAVAFGAALVIGAAAAAAGPVLAGALVGGGLIAAEATVAGIAVAPMVAGVAVTVGELAANVVVGGWLTEKGEEIGKAIGSKSMQAPSGKIIRGSPNVSINSLPAARVEDEESCDAGKVAQGSATVFINGKPAARVGDKVTCGATIVSGSRNVFIGGGTITRLSVQSEVSEAVRFAALVIGILPAIGGLARATASAFAAVKAGGFARAAQTGVKALGRAMEERGGGAPGNAAATAAGTASADAKAVAAAKIGTASKNAEIEEARDALKRLDYNDRKDVLNDFANRMDVSTKPGTATFWSGGRMMPTGPGGKMEWNSARSWAEARGVAGRSTVEQTPGGHVLDKLDVFRDGDELLKPADASGVWDTASARFTDGASGEIHAYIDNPRAQSIYTTTERPKIMEAAKAGKATLKEFDLDQYHDRMAR